MTSGLILRDRGICVPDNPLSPYVLPRWFDEARLVAELACEQGLGDNVAWEAILGDVSYETTDRKGRVTLHLAPTLAAYKVVYGNRRRRKGSGGSKTLRVRGSARRSSARRGTTPTLF